MKKIIVLVAIMAMICGNLCSAYAYSAKVETVRDSSIQPYYVGVSRSTALLNIKGKQAEYAVRVIPKSKTSISKIIMTVKLVNNNGTVIQTKTETLTISNGAFESRNIKTLSARGQYHVEYSGKVYKRSQLIETISGKSGIKTY